MHKNPLLFPNFWKLLHVADKMPDPLYIFFFYSYIYIYYKLLYRQKKICNICNKTPQSIGITAFALLQNCCRCVALVAKTVAEIVAFTVTSCCTLLHHPFIVSCNNLQQIFLSFLLVSATESVQFCNTICNAYLFTNIVYLYICNNFCNNFSLISLQIAIYIYFLFLRFLPFFVRNYTHFRFLCGKF